MGATGEDHPAGERDAGAGVRVKPTGDGYHDRLIRLVKEIGPIEGARAHQLVQLQAMVAGYHPTKLLKTGEVAAVADFLFTAGLVVGLDKHAVHRTRFCYETREDAEAALEAWDGKGDPPGPWIKQKPEDRHGPGMMRKYERATVKFNNGMGALLCDKCGVIIATGFGHIDMAHLCDDCKSRQ